MWFINYEGFKEVTEGFKRHLVKQEYIFSIEENDESLTVSFPSVPYDRILKVDFNKELLNINITIDYLFRFELLSREQLLLIVNNVNLKSNLMSYLIVTEENKVKTTYKILATLLDGTPLITPYFITETMEVMLQESNHLINRLKDETYK